MHEIFERDESVIGPSDRKFGLTFAVVFGLIGIASLISHGTHGLYWLVCAFILFVVSLAVPGMLAPFNRLWLRLGLLLHKVVSPIILGLIFFGVMTPMGIVMRLTGKDFLRARRAQGVHSYWIVRDPPGPPPGSLSNQF